MMKKILLLLANGFEVFEASVFIDVMGWNLIEGDKSTKLYTCGFTKEVKSSFNQKFVVDYLIEDINIDDFDALAVPGGFEEFDFYKEAYDEKFQNIIRGFHQQNKPIASICVGALALGRSGILKGKKATTYNQNPLRLETLKSFGAEFINQPIVVDNNIITSYGPATAMDVALLLLRQLSTEENTLHIKKIMGF